MHKRLLGREGEGYSVKYGRDNIITNLDLLIHPVTKKYIGYSWKTVNCEAYMSIGRGIPQNRDGFDPPRLEFYSCRLLKPPWGLSGKKTKIICNSRSLHFKERGERYRSR